LCSARGKNEKGIYGRMRKKKNVPFLFERRRRGESVAEKRRKKSTGHIFLFPACKFARGKSKIPPF